MSNLINKIINEPLLIVLVCLFVLLIIFLGVLIIKYLKTKKAIDLNFEASKEIAPEAEKSFEKSELENLLDKMATDLKEAEEEKKDLVETYEFEQEENAIISYQELLAATKKNDKQEERVVEKLEFDSEPEVVSENIMPEVFNNFEEEPKKFKSTEFISPVFGIVKDNSNIDYNEKITIPKTINNIELEKTLDMKPLSMEIKQNDEFLKALKDFRRNL